MYLVSTMKIEFGVGEWDSCRTFRHNCSVVAIHELPLRPPRAWLTYQTGERSLRSWLTGTPEAKIRLTKPFFYDKIIEWHCLSSVKEILLRNSGYFDLTEIPSFLHHWLSITNSWAKPNLYLVLGRILNQLWQEIRIVFLYSAINAAGSGLGSE